jgi:hypothetical protein
MSRPLVPALVAASFVSALLLTGCATTTPPQTTGTLMAAEAGRASEMADMKGELADQWKRGQAMISAGEKQIAKAESQSAGAARDVARYSERTERARTVQQQAALSLAEGRDKVAEGRRLKNEAEGQFTFAPLPAQ